MSGDESGADAVAGKTQIERAEARIEQAEARTEQAKSRAELAETRTEQAEARIEQAEMRTEQAKSRIEQAQTRTEQAETRTEQAETRTEQAETTLHILLDQLPEVSAQPLTGIPTDRFAEQLHQLTRRQREILKLIAEGKNTKQIGEMLKISPKTVEYHRGRLMNCLDVHDIPGLVRFALRVGLIPPES